MSERSGTVSLVFSGTTPAIGYVDRASGKVGLAEGSGKTFTSTTVGTVSTTGKSGVQVLVDPKTHQPAVVYHDTTGTYVASSPTDGSGTFQVTQVQSGSSNTMAAIQPGSGSMVFTTISNINGTLSVNTNTTPPKAPTSVAATSDAVTSATITWTDNSDNEAGFLIERSIDGTTFTTAGTVAPNVTTFSDTGLLEGTTYYYRVSAIGAAGNNSAGSTDAGGGQIVPAAGLATVTTLAAAATDLAAVAASDTEISLSWTDHSNNEQGYTVSRASADGSAWVTVATLGAHADSYTDTALTEGTAYTYEVSTFNAAGVTPAVGSASAYTLPAAPSTVSATPTSTTAVTITWQNNSQAVTGFVVQRSTDGVTYTTLATPGASARMYSDTGLTEATAFYYRVLATGPGDHTSAPSDPTNVITDPAAPSNLAATALSPTRIDLAWTGNTQAASNYIVQRAANGGAFGTITTLAGSAASYSDTGLTEGVTYSYRVQASTSGSLSSYSAVVSKITLPACADQSGGWRQRVVRHASLDGQFRQRKRLQNPAQRE